MKNIRFFLFLATVTLTLSCGDMYEVAEEFMNDIIYPGKFDTIYATLGFERVELDLMKAGRIPPEQIYLGKAVKTVIEYDDKRLVWDELRSWVNIPDMNVNRLYRIRAFTEDKYGNRSIPQEITVVPFTAMDRDLIEVTPPKITIAPTTAVFEWPYGVQSIQMDYHGYEYEYKDKDGRIRTGKNHPSDRLFLGNLAPNSEVDVKFKFSIVPVFYEEATAVVPNDDDDDDEDGENDDDGMRLKRLLDDITIERTISFVTPDAGAPFTPDEKDALNANGIVDFTPTFCATVTKLALPMHINSLSDLLYFSGLKELDLTGGGLNHIKEVTYSNRGALWTMYGGAWLPFMARRENPRALVNNPDNDIVITGVQTMVDLLESGILEKVKYIPLSMGKPVDDALAPFVSKGQVELIRKDNPAVFPTEVMIPNSYYIEGAMNDPLWEIEVTYPADDVPVPEELIDAGNVYKCVLLRRAPNLPFWLPEQYRIDAENYRYLKVKLFTTSPDEAFTVTAHYQRYKSLFARYMNHVWTSIWPGVDSQSRWGQENWNCTDNPQPNLTNTPNKFTIPEENLRTHWTEFTWDLQDGSNAGVAVRHSRVILFGLGGDPAASDLGTGSDGILSTQNPIVLYFADIRLSKEQ